MTKFTEPTARLVTVTATDGLLLPALLFEPAQPTKRAVVWLHGMGSSGIFYSPDHTNALAAALTGAGIAFLGLQNRGGGLLQGVKYFDADGNKLKKTQGTTHELIADCVKDIDGAITFAHAHGYTELYLGGHSTGANKTALYSYLKPKNDFTSYVLYGGGDDTGVAYEEMGEAKFHRVLDHAQKQIEGGHGADLAPFDDMGDYFSYQSAADILNPDGDYNVFPYYEAQHQRLGTKPLFREFKSITKPTLIVYGELDEWARPTPAACLEILKSAAPIGIDITYRLIPGADHGCYRHEPELAKTIADWQSGHQ